MLETKKKNQIRRYRQFMKEEDSEEIKSLFTKINMPSIWGRDEFIEWAKETFFKEKRNQEVPESKALAPDIDKIIKKVSNFYEVEESELIYLRRGRENEARDVAIFLIRTPKNGKAVNYWRKV